MEIEFSPNQMPVQRASVPDKGTPTKSSSSNDTVSIQGMAELQSKLDQLALTRPEKMASLRPALMDVQYPPEELLNGIAHLLAIRLSQ